MSDTSSSDKNTTPSSSWSIASIVISVIVVLIVYGGAAKLSYDRYGSIGWAFIAFAFSPFYYPYYAYFISSRSTSMLGGMRRMKW